MCHMLISSTSTVTRDDVYFWLPRTDLSSLLLIQIPSSLLYPFIYLSHALLDSSYDQSHLFSTDLLIIRKEERHLYIYIFFFLSFVLMLLG